MVPIATALAFIAMLLFIFGSYKMSAGADYVSNLILRLLIRRMLIIRLPLDCLSSLPS